MHDLYLVYLLLLAAVLAGGYGRLLVWFLRHPGVRASGFLVGFLGVVVILAVFCLLATAGRAVGVNFTDLTGQ